jgi:environmental stress-induced protein Ves
MRILRADEAKATPWKNGGGVTRELLRLPLPGGGADDWLLRISVADIDADGPFSPFDGIARSFAVLSGHGVDLSWKHTRRRMTVASEPLAFDGAQAPGCRLVDGPTRDLNVMTPRAAADAELRRAAFDGAFAWEGDGRGVFALRPLVLEADGRRMALPALALAWSDVGDAQPWRVHAADGAAADGSDAPPAYWIGLRRNERLRD